MKLIRSFLKNSTSSQNIDSVYRSGLHISAQDTGIGVSPEELESIFSEYHQGKNINELQITTGTGLGLSIAKKLIGLMNGNITCHSINNHGTRFDIEVPALAVSPNNENTPIKIQDVSKDILKTLKILVVEDNATNRKIVDLFLQDLGVQRVFANDGEECIHILSQDPGVNLIFIDINLGINKEYGYEVTKRIKKMNLISQPQIIALAANAFTQDRAKALEVGMDGFISKPYRKSELAQAIYQSITKEKKPTGSN